MLRAVVSFVLKPAVWVKTHFVTNRLPWSLSRRTRKAIRKQDGVKLFAVPLRMLVKHWRASIGMWALLWPAALAFSGAWFAWPSAGVPTLHGSTRGPQFLTSVWQIEAVALSLSVAVIIFGFQAFSGSRHARSSGALLTFATDSGLFLELGVGIGGLFLAGFVLAGYGSGGPTGWAGTWADCFCGVGLVMIPVAFIQTVLGIDPARLNSRRSRRLGRAVDSYVAADLRDRFAIDLAEHLCSAHGMKRLLISIPSVRKEFRLVPNALSGVVKDVRLRRLSRLAGKSTGNDERAFLIARIGARVRPGDPIAVLPTARRERKRRERRIVRVERGDPDDTLSSLIGELHDDAIAAIHDESLAAFERTALEYRALLLAFPRSWSTHNIRYTEELTTGIGLDLGVFSRIEPLMRDEMREVMRAGNVRLANVLTSLAFRVAADAVPYGARGLYRQMLRLIVVGYITATQLQDKAMCGDCLGKVFELVRLIVLPQVQGEATQPLPWDEAVLLVVVSFEEIGEMLRQVTDLGVATNVSEVDDRWSEVTSLWRPDIEAPVEALVEVQALQHGEQHPGVQAARREVEESKRQIELLNFLREQRSTFRFELAAWQLRRVRASVADDHDAASIFKLLAQHFTDTNRLQSAADSAFNSLFTAGGGHFQRWVFSEAAAASLGYAPRSSPNSEGGLIACFLTLLVMSTHPDAGTPVFDTTDWMVSRADSLRAELDVLEGETGLWEQLEVDRVADRMALLRVALGDADSRRRSEQDERIAAQLPEQGLVDTTTEQVRAIWRANRIAPALFRAFSSVVVEDQLPPDGTEHFLVQATVPKTAFVADNFANESFLYSELGRAAANNEMPILISRVMSGSEAITSPGTRAEAIRGAVHSMRGEGFTPSLLFTSIDWRLMEELGLRSWEKPTPSFELPEATQHWYKGTFEGVHVIAWPRVLTNQVLIVDLEKYGHWRQWIPPGEQELSIRVEFVDEQEAIRLATADPSLGADATHQTVGERALRLQSEAVVRIFERWTIETNNVLAARILDLPQDDSQT